MPNLFAPGYGEAIRRTGSAAGDRREGIRRTGFLALSQRKEFAVPDCLPAVGGKNSPHRIVCAESEEGIRRAGLLALSCGEGIRCTERHAGNRRTSFGVPDGLPTNEGNPVRRMDIKNPDDSMKMVKPLAFKRILRIMISLNTNCSFFVVSEGSIYQVNHSVRSFRQAQRPGRRAVAELAEATLSFKFLSNIVQKR